ncbi:MAG: rod shape-determining protein RodA [Erythrobacter sp. 34-65-8]|nr:MAG: rod shape-determining protein RodA [Erythrobacter sp. 34-65-8]
MISIIPAPLARQPWQMLVPMLLLAGFGAMVLYSAGGGAMQPYALPHLVRFAVFLVIALVISRLSRELIMLLAYPAFAGVLLMLLGVEVVGAVKGGSQRWLELGFMRLQPSELMKPTICLVLATYYARLPIGLIPTFKALMPAFGFILLPVALVLMQPDLGTSVAIVFSAFIVMFLAGLPLWWFMSAGAAAVVLAPVVFFFGLHEYQQKRVTTFLDPENDPLGAGYHISQSKIAIGSGGLFGKGFNEGSQSHLNYLPEPHTDFVFSSMAEEWGLVGGLFVLLMYALILRWGLQVARASKDRFGGLLAGGVTATIFFYIAINLLMVMGLAPAKGMPLPWMSHGGSSMLTAMICIGTLMMVHRWNREAARGGMRG